MRKWKMEFKDCRTARLVEKRLERRGYIVERKGRSLIVEGEKRPWGELGYAPVWGPAPLK